MPPVLETERLTAPARLVRDARRKLLVTILGTQVAAVLELLDFLDLALLISIVASIPSP